MAAINSIIEWAADLPGWLADTVRRHLASSDSALAEKDFDEVLAMAMTALKLTDETPPCTPILPTTEMFSGTPQASINVSLDAVEAGTNVNAIKAGQSLPFAAVGVTVVYGSNGAGKSGYVRILKLACRARDKQERILPNVFSVGAAGPASATVKLTINGTPTPFAWVQGKDADPLLAHVTVFDARCARVIVDDRNEVTYLPYGADVFEKVAQTAIRVRTAIEAQFVAVDPLQDSAVVAGTPAALFLSQLAHSTTSQSLELATAWTASDDQVLAKTETLIHTSDAEKLASEVARLGKTRERIEAARIAIIACETSVSELTNAVAQQRSDELVAAQAAYNIAVAERQSKEPLPGSASTNEWELLYKAAKEYSESIAYPGVSFPNTIDQALCVLCQQPLAPEAKERFERFKRFVEDTTAELLRQRRAALNALAAKFDALQPWSGVALDAVCEDMAPFSPSAPDAVRGFHQSLGHRQKSAQETLDQEPKPGQQIQWPAVSPTPTQLIHDALTALDARVLEIKTAAKPEELKTLITKRDGLRSRKALNARLADIVTHVQILKRNEQLKRGAESIRTAEITREGTALIKRSLTPTLLAALKTEMNALGAAHIKLSMKPSGAGGETTHEMLLEGAQSGLKAKLSQVLSEGEQRVIAIAGFLAELGIAQHTNPVVFDDPVSSLDHEFTQRIAARLAREGLKRQVVAFSHDIAFLMELQDAATELGKAGTPVAVSVQTLRRRAAEAGIGSEGLPWHAESVKQRVSSLEKELQSIAPLYTSDLDRYNDAAARLYGLLREAWEACVEEDLLFAVVSRYRNSVKTLQLYEVSIEDEDVLAIDRHMSRCSTWMTGHDKSKALSVNRPTPHEIGVDINHLRVTSKVLRGRRTATRDRREGKLVPPALPATPAS